MSGERKSDLSSSVTVVTSLQQVKNLRQQSVSLAYIDSIKLYILSPVVICNYAIEISRSVSTSETHY